MHLINTYILSVHHITLPYYNILFVLLLPHPIHASEYYTQPTDHL